jgi:hypothetical protein
MKNQELRAINKEKAGSENYSTQDKATEFLKT